MGDVSAYARRAIARAAAPPSSVFNDPYRRATLDRHAAEVMALAGRVVAELFEQAADPRLGADDRRGLVAIALEVDRCAALRVGAVPATVELAARGRAALAVEAPR